jgi:hypothetical protein
MKRLFVALCLAFALGAAPARAEGPAQPAELPPLPPPTAASASAPAPSSAPAPTSTGSADVLVLRAPALATHDAPAVENPPSRPKRFYESGWFWGALGAAALIGGSIYLATQDTSTPTIHLQVQVPH